MPFLRVLMIEIIRKLKRNFNYFYLWNYIENKVTELSTYDLPRNDMLRTIRIIIIYLHIFGDIIYFLIQFLMHSFLIVNLQ